MDIYRWYVSIMLTLALISMPLVLARTPKLKIGYWSSWHVKCGIAAYTQHLYDALVQAGHQVYVYQHTLRPKELLLQVDKDRINLLNIQYEAALMPPLVEFLEVVEAIKELGVKIVITLHSEPPWIAQLRAIADKCIYHKTPVYKPQDPKVAHIPMGVPVFTPHDTREQARKKYGFEAGDQILATAGFMFGWKGHAYILHALAPKLKENPRCYVQLLVSFSDINYAPCAQEYARIKAIIDKYKLHNQVIFITSYLSQAELNERLWISDLGYLWADIESTSSSAAAKEFIASRLPLVVTTSSHYHDLQCGVVKTLPNRALFVEALWSTLHDATTLSLLREQLEGEYRRLCYTTLIADHCTLFYTILR